MKLTLKMLAAAALAAASTGCSNFLDVNNNVNSLTTENPPTPAAVLANALNTTAALYSVSYNSYASFAAGYWGKSGIVNGYAEERTYTYSSNYYSGLFSGTYDNLNDYNFIQTNNPVSYPYHAAIARIMKVYDYLLLVDQYGDIPYTQALKGRDNLNPSYDKAADIYKDLIVQLTEAIADINAANTNATAPGSTIVTVGSEDIVFNGGAAGMTNWKRFANSLKLRILLRESSTSDATLNAYVKAQMTALQTGATDGYITTDVVSQPGYLQSSGQQNPLFSTYGLTSTGGSTTQRRYQIPTNYILRAYTSNSDPRVAQLYARGTKAGSTITYNGGTYVGTDLGETNPPTFTGSIVGSIFLVGTNPAASGPGILKGYSAATPLMLLAEHLFNKAEAETRGLFTGGDAAAKTDFNNGILASFLYFYRLPVTAPSTVASASVATPGFSQYTTYTTLASNLTNPLVNYDAAVTAGTQANTILFQKYLAENTIAAIEALDDYRRTKQPPIKTSVDPRAIANGFPYRLYYPQSELNVNASNVPTGVTQFTHIFWQP